MRAVGHSSQVSAAIRTTCAASFGASTRDSSLSSGEVAWGLLRKAVIRVEL